MRQTTTFEIEDSDYELLKTQVPKDPCKHCSNSYACCGCPESRKREEIIRPLKQAGIFEIQQKSARNKRVTARAQRDRRNYCSEQKFYRKQRI